MDTSVIYWVNMINLFPFKASVLYDREFIYGREKVKNKFYPKKSHMGAFKLENLLILIMKFGYFISHRNNEPNAVANQIIIKSNLIF